MQAVLSRISRRLHPARPRPLILMYHRVATPAVDPWGLAVSPRHFEEQLATLSRTRTVLSLADMVSQLQSGTLPANAVALSFDDGYADNLSQAAPRLLHTGIPATLFVATDFLDQPREYWWDELATLLLGDTAIDCDVDDGHQIWRVRVGGSDDEASRSWRAWQEPATDRQRAFSDTYTRLRARPAVDRERVVACLRNAAGGMRSLADDRPMTAGELRAWSDTQGLDVGAHTRTHPFLPALDRAAADHEILGSKRACERLLNRTIAGFAYPHGGQDEHVRRLVAQNGFAWACTTEPRALQPHEPDLYALPRLAAPDCDAGSFERVLQAACVS